MILANVCSTEWASTDGVICCGPIIIDLVVCQYACSSFAEISMPDFRLVLLVCDD